MKKTDIIAIAAFVFLAALVFFFPWGVDLLGQVKWMGIDFCGCFRDLSGLDNFGHVVANYPYVSGFIKVGILASFGEMIKTRGKTGSYRTPDLWAKFIVWGIYGMLFTLVFAIFAKGIGGLSGSPVWPFRSDSRFWNTLIFAFSTSLWLNLVFCSPMMMTHEWFNTCIANRRMAAHPLPVPPLRSSNNRNRAMPHLRKVLLHPSGDFARIPFFRTVS